MWHSRIKVAKMKYGYFVAMLKWQKKKKSYRKITNFFFILSLLSSIYFFTLFYPFTANSAHNKKRKTNLCTERNLLKLYRFSCMLKLKLGYHTTLFNTVAQQNWVHLSFLKLIFWQSFLSKQNLSWHYRTKNFCFLSSIFFFFFCFVL